MDRFFLEEYINETYNAVSDHPWERYPDYTVFRHSNNKKWFAVIMRVSKNKLGLSGDGEMDIVNLKCDPIMIGSFRSEPGIFPDYHMSKANWISVALDECVSEEKLKMLLDISYDLTAPKRNRRSTPADN